MLVRLIISLICATPLYYLDILGLRDNFEQIIPVHCLALTVLLVLEIGRRPTIKPRFTDFEEVYILYLFYTNLRSAFLKDWDVRDLSLQVLATLLYFVLKGAFALDRRHGLNRYLYTNFLIIFFAIFAIFIGQTCIQGRPMRTFFLPNSSAIGIYMAILLATLLPLFWTWMKIFSVRWPTILGVVGLTAGILLVIWFNSRSSWLGLFVAIFYLLVTSTSVKKKQRGLLIGSLMLLLGLGSGLYYYKEQSSEGRVLILQVSKDIFTDNPLWGVGASKFRIAYPDYQASYFVRNGIDTQQALLADNTFFTFNDLLQVAIEQGVIGLMLIGISLFLVVRKLLRQSKKCLVEKGCLAGLVCFGVTTLFFYAVHLFPVLLLVSLFLAVVNGQQIADMEKTEQHTTRSLLLKLGIIAMLSLLSVHFWNWFQYETSVKRGTDLLTSGYRSRGHEELFQIKDSYLNNGKAMLLYGRSLYNCHFFEEAAAVVESASNRFNSNECYLLKGDIEEAMGNYDAAEQAYLTAVYMVPNRMRPRLLLAQFYSAKMDTIRTYYWARSVLNMVVKVPSPQTDYYREKAKNMMGNK